MLLSLRVSEMDKLLEAIASLISLISPEKVQAVALGVRRSDPTTASSTLTSIVGTATASHAVKELVKAWNNTAVSADEVAAMLLAGSHVHAKVMSEQSIELVWTGPTTNLVSARRTEQALLQVINSAEHSLFVTSFVAYDVTTIVSALNAAIARGVSVSMLLELSQEHGGSISFDAIGKMKTLVSAAHLYAWRYKEPEFLDGRVHAKVAVADGRMCFITSANLTGHAMEKNMEAGVLISGGYIPKLLESHLQSLVDTQVITSV